MGFLRDLFRRLFGTVVPAPTLPNLPGPAASTASSRSRPRILNAEDPNSPMVLVDTGNGMVTMMDREGFDYLYGETTAPDPAQADLDEVLPLATRVRATAGGLFRGLPTGGEVLVDTADPAALAAFRGCFAIDPDPATFGHCMCLGGPTLELFAGDAPLAVIGLQHGHAIRWRRWKHDARLRDGTRLTAWLIAHGAGRTRLEQIYHGGQQPFGLPAAARPTPGQEEANARLEVAEKLRHEGRLDEALAECEQVLAKDPEAAGALGLRGLIRREQGDLDGAVADCTAAIRRGRHHPEIYFARAVALDLLGRAEEALADCDVVLRLDPRHANALNSRGLIRGRLGQLDAALADLDTAVRSQPGWFLAHWNRGAMRRQRGDLDGCIADYTEVIRLLANAPGDSGVTTRARMQARPTRLLQTDRLSPAAAYLRRGLAFEERGDLDRAAADLDEALRRDPAFALARNARGRLRLRRQQWAAAADDFAEVIRQCPEDPEAYLHRSAARRALGQPEAALADLDACLACDPGQAMVYGLRGEVRAALGQAEAALADLDHAARLAPDEARVYLARADLHGRARRFAAQRADLETAYRLTGHHPLAGNLLAWLLATCPDDAVRDPARGLEVAEAVLAKLPQPEPAPLDTLAAALAAVGRFAEAVRRQEEALALLPPAADCGPYEDRLALYRTGRPFRDGL